MASPAGMKHGPHILVATLDGQRDHAHHLCATLTDGWTDPPDPNFLPVDEHDLVTGDLGPVDMVILLADHDQETSQRLHLLTMLDDADVAVIAIVNQRSVSGGVFGFSNALSLHSATPVDQVMATVRGLLHRQDEIKTLRREIAVAQRFHGGLRGEITRIHEELQLAAMVQREFLPREVPKLHGVDFGVMWRPANYVSGDIYDIQRLDLDHIGLFIADAVGHGVPAALMTMVICRSLTTHKRRGEEIHIIEPCEVLHRLNEEMIQRQGRTTRFATAVYAVINCRTRAIRLAGAGHPPPLYLKANGDSSLIETSGGLLGVFDDERYEQIELNLAEHDRIIFYSDGFEQAFPDVTDDDYARRLPTTRYREEFEQHGIHDSPDDVIKALSARVDDQVGSLHQTDDLTLICMHAGPLVISPDRRQEARETVNSGDPAQSQAA
jgi:sigma-B regulation protein RsbU (phosphoserine phosphatase)